MVAEYMCFGNIRRILICMPWVNDTLAEVTFKFDGSITYCYYSRGSDSKVFRNYLYGLESKIAAALVEM